MKNKLKYMGIMSLALVAMGTSQGAFAGMPDPVQDERFIAYNYDGQVPVAYGESEFTAYQYDSKPSIDPLGEYSSGALSTNSMNFSSFGGLDQYKDRAKTLIGDKFTSLTGGNNSLAQFGLGAGAAAGALGGKFDAKSLQGTATNLLGKQASNLADKYGLSSVGAQFGLGAGAAAGALGGNFDVKSLQGKATDLFGKQASGLADKYGLSSVGAKFGLGAGAAGALSGQYGIPTSASGVQGMATNYLGELTSQYSLSGLGSQFGFGGGTGGGINLSSLGGNGLNTLSTSFGSGGGVANIASNMGGISTTLRGLGGGALGGVSSIFVDGGGGGSSASGWRSQ